MLALRRFKYTFVRCHYISSPVCMTGTVVVVQAIVVDCSSSRDLCLPPAAAPHLGRPHRQLLDPPLNARRLATVR